MGLEFPRLICLDSLATDFITGIHLHIDAGYLHKLNGQSTSSSSQSHLFLSFFRFFFLCCCCFVWEYFLAGNKVIFNEGTALCPVMQMRPPLCKSTP